MRFMVGLVLLFLLSGCEQNSVSVVRAYLDQEFSLKVGQQASVRGEDLRITFRAVVEDSRCPEGAMCIWAGNGRIEVELRSKGFAATILELNTYMEPKRISYVDYQIQLKSLWPYPRLGARINPSDYVATLMVSR